MNPALLRVLLLMLAMSLGGAAVARAGEQPIAVGCYVGVLRDVPRKDVELSLRFWIEELAHLVQAEYEPVRLYDDIAVMAGDLDKGKINFVVAPALEVVRHFPLGSLADGFSGFFSQDDELLLLVRADAGIAAPSGLRGKRVLLLEDDALSALYLENLLMGAGLRSDLSQLGQVGHELHSSRLIHRLFFAQADAGLIYRSAYETARALNPQIGARLQVLPAYTLHIRSPYVGLFAASVDAQDRERLILRAMDIEKTARGRQLLQVYRAEHIQANRVSDLQPFIALFEEHRKLKRAERMRGK